MNEHDDVRALLPELAAQACDGGDRATALEHLPACLACRAELAQLAELVDAMLLLAPAVPPPDGFTEAVLTRLAADRPPGTDPQRPASGRAPAPRDGRRPTALVAVAAMLVVGVGTATVAGAAVWRRTAPDRELAAAYRHTLQLGHGQDLQAAPLRGPDGTELGTVFAYRGEPSWVYVTFRAAPQPGRYDVVLVTADGRRLPLRAFTATAASTGWGSTVPVDLEQLRSLRFAAGRRPAMTADFS